MNRNNNREECIWIWDQTMWLAGWHIGFSLSPTESWGCILMILNGISKALKLCEVLVIEYHLRWLSFLEYTLHSLIGKGFCTAPGPGQSKVISPLRQALNIRLNTSYALEAQPNLFCDYVVVSGPLCVHLCFSGFCSKW